MRAPCLTLLHLCPFRGWFAFVFWKSQGIEVTCSALVSKWQDGSSKSGLAGWYKMGTGICAFPLFMLLGRVSVRTARLRTWLRVSLSHLTVSDEEPEVCGRPPGGWGSCWRAGLEGWGALGERFICKTSIMQPSSRDSYEDSTSNLTYK